MDCEKDDIGFLYAQLPGQNMRVLWDGFKVSIDGAVRSNELADIEFAATHYANLIEAAETLPNNQADFWIERADDYLPQYWLVWMHWLDQWDASKTEELDD